MNCGTLGPATPANSGSTPPMDTPTRSTHAINSGPKSRVLCFRAPCPKYSHISCNRKCCKLCCVIEGGCRAKGHNQASISENQRRKIHGSVRRLGAITGSQGPEPASFSSSQPQTPTPTYAEREVSWAESLHRLDNLIENPMDKLMERAEKDRALAQEEERQFEAALAASLSDSSTPVPSSSASLFRTGTSVAGIPVTIVTPKNRPTITTQMNNDWMRPFENRTLEEPRRGRAQTDIEVARKFRITLWDKVSV